MRCELTDIHTTRIETVATASLSVATSGQGFVDITREAARFLERIGARDGALLLFIRHTSASLVIQENADPDVQVDLSRPRSRAWRRTTPAGCTTPKGRTICRRM